MKVTIDIPKPCGITHENVEIDGKYTLTIKDTIFHYNTEYARDFVVLEIIKALKTGI